MRIETVTLADFRNYRKQTVELASGLNFFIGANGEGKTNFLESIYALALSKSYKAEDREMVRFESPFARARASVMSSAGRTDLQLILAEDGKKALANGQEVKRLSDYVGILNVVLFAPEDMNLVKGSPVDRRYFLDVVLGQIDKRYLDDLSAYKHALKQRNELLKQAQPGKDIDRDLLDVLTEQLAAAGEAVIAKRAAFIAALDRKAAKAYQFLSVKQEDLGLTYQPSVAENLLSALKTRYRSDLFSGTTNHGPHRDDLGFLLNGMPAASFASQGEQRMIVLAVDLALVEYIEETKHERPLFLLDDVLSELDREKQNRLLRRLMETGIQAIVTATELTDIADDIIASARIFRVAQGTIKEEHHGQ
jgi:DNA replication and repair protein RecF